MLIVNGTLIGVLKPLRHDIVVDFDSITKVTANLDVHKKLMQETLRNLPLK